MSILECTAQALEVRVPDLPSDGDVLHWMQANCVLLINQWSDLILIWFKPQELSFSLPHTWSLQSNTRGSGREPWSRTSQTAAVGGIPHAAIDVPWLGNNAQDSSQTTAALSGQSCSFEEPSEHQTKKPIWFQNDSASNVCLWLPSMTAPQNQYKIQKSYQAILNWSQRIHFEGNLTRIPHPTCKLLAIKGTPDGCRAQVNNKCRTCQDTCTCFHLLFLYLQLQNVHNLYPVHWLPKWDLTRCNSYYCQHEVTQMTQLAADEHFLQINPSILVVQGKAKKIIFETWAWEQKFINLWDTEK